MPSINELLQDLYALNQCYEMESRHRKQWYETARKRAKELAAQQQEIERLRGENAELLQENVKLLTPTHDEFRQLLAARRKGERAVDVQVDPSWWHKAAQHHAMTADVLEKQLERAKGLLWQVVNMNPPQLPQTVKNARAFLEPPHEREVPVRDSTVRVSGVSVEPGVPGSLPAAEGVPDERPKAPRGPIIFADTGGAATAPASPVREGDIDSLLRNAAKMVNETCLPNGRQANIGWHWVEKSLHQYVKPLLEEKDAELAALRKRVEEGERALVCADRAIYLSHTTDEAWAEVEKNWKVAEAILGSKASRAKRDATPEPKEPANG